MRTGLLLDLVADSVGDRVAIGAVNGGPLKEPCRIGTWSVSIRFS